MKVVARPAFVLLYLALVRQPDRDRADEVLACRLWARLQAEAR